MLLLVSKMYACDDALQTSICPEDMDLETAHVCDQVSRFEKRSCQQNFWQKQRKSWLEREQTDWALFPGFYAQFSLYKQAKDCVHQNRERINTLLVSQWDECLLPTFKRMAKLVGKIGRCMQDDRINMSPKVPLSKAQMFTLVPVEKSPEKAAAFIQTHWRRVHASHSPSPRRGPLGSKIA